MPDDPEDIIIITARCSDMEAPTWPSSVRKCGDCGAAIWLADTMLPKVRDPRFKKFICSVCLEANPPAPGSRVVPPTPKDWADATRGMTPSERARAALRVLLLTGREPPSDA